MTEPEYIRLGEVGAPEQATVLDRAIAEELHVYVEVVGGQLMHTVEMDHPKDLAALQRGDTKVAVTPKLPEDLQRVVDEGRQWDGYAVVGPHALRALRRGETPAPAWLDVPCERGELSVAWGRPLGRHWLLVRLDEWRNLRRPIPPEPTNPGARKYNVALQRVIDQIAAELPLPCTITALKAYFRERNAVSGCLRGGKTVSVLESHIPDCDEVYIDGAKLVWKDRDGRERSCSLRSLERYLKRARKPCS